jgi:hypothetical protein
MAEKNRDQNQTSERESQLSDQNSEINRSNQPRQDQNPQDGNQWNNYQTREMGNEGRGEENLKNTRSE